MTLIASVIDSQLTGMKMFLKDTSFHGVMLDKLFSASTELKKVLHDIITEGILSGVVRPLNRSVFPNTEVEQAFRCACHDKVVTRMAEQNLQTAVLLHSFLVLHILILFLLFYFNFINNFLLKYRFCIMSSLLI